MSKEREGKLPGIEAANAQFDPRLNPKGVRAEGPTMWVMTFGFMLNGKQEIIQTKCPTVEECWIKFRDTWEKISEGAKANMDQLQVDMRTEALLMSQAKASQAAASGLILPDGFTVN